MTEEVDDFLKRFQSEIRDRALGMDGESTDFSENVFTDYVIELLSSEIGVIEGAETVYFEGKVNRGRAKVNGYALAEDRTDQETIDLFASVYLGEETSTPVPADTLKAASEHAMRFLVGALGTLYREVDPSSERYSMCKRIHDARGQIKRARLFVLTDGVTDLARRQPRIVQPQGSSVEVQIEFWDIERMTRAFAYDRPRQDIEIDITSFNGSPIPCVAAQGAGSGYDAYLMIVPGTFLQRIYDLFGSRLLERNVRAFLQAKGKVNTGIRRTLRDEPERFLAYNNGISMTADAADVEIRADGSAFLLSMRGLQIVNGGQTTASIHRAARTDRADLSKVQVQAKLTVLNEDVVEEIAPKIAEYANSQNPIQMADFSANDPFHIELERLSQQIWTPDQRGRWFYERARGQYQTAQAKIGDTPAKRRQFREIQPPHRKLTKLDVAKVLNIWDQLPHVACLGGQKSFVRFTQRLRETRPKTWSPDDAYFKDTVAKHLVFTAMNKVARREFEGYRAQISAYTVALLANRSADQLDLDLVWKQQSASEEMTALLTAWSREVANRLISSAGSRNVSEWCKKADCWQSVVELEADWPEVLPPEFGRMHRTGRGWGNEPDLARRSIDPAELEARKAIRGLPARDWIRVLDWGTSTGALDPGQRSLASEIARLAASGWQNDLSARKALEGHRILLMAIESRALENEQSESTA